MTDPKPPVDDFSERLARARADHRGKAAEKDDQAEPGSIGRAYRMGIDLAAALVVGVGLGWAVDSQFHTRPWGLIIGFFLGSAAGMLNVWRAMQGFDYSVGYRRAGDRSGKVPPSDQPPSPPPAAGA